MYKMKPFTHEVHYFKNGKEIRPPVPAYDKEDIASHTRMCRTGWGGDTIKIIDDFGISLILNTKRDKKGTIAEAFNPLMKEYVNNILIT